MTTSTSNQPGVTPLDASPINVSAGHGAQFALSATDLHKTYGDTVALGGVSIGVAHRSSTAIMGPSGSGKSTLLHCLAGFVRPDSGTVSLDGHRIDGLRERAATRLRRERFGFVFQSDQLLAELHAVENVALPLMLGGMARAEAVAQAQKWFGPLGLDGLEHRRPGQLSGGQLQRVSIARALVVTPSVVVADEPTAALDRATSHETMRVLTEHCRAQGAALVVVTHDPEVAQWCDQVATMRDGVILSVESAVAVSR